MNNANKVMNTQGRMIDYKAQLDYQMLNEYIDILVQRYRIISVTSIGQTVMGKRIPMISIGRGKKTVLYVGAIYGTDWQTSSVLLRYANELCEHIEGNGRIYNCSAAYLAVTKTVNIIPMLNPDGVEYCMKGIEEDNPLYERIISGKDVDLKKWNGNARGIDLRTGFGNDFDSGNAEGLEPETGSLRNYLMFNRDIRMVLSLLKGKKSVQCTYESTTPPKLNSIGRSIADQCSAEYSRCSMDGSLSAFCARELVIPSYEVRSEFSDQSDSFCDYYRLRSMLFLAPTMI